MGLIHAKEVTIDNKKVKLVEINGDAAYIDLPDGSILRSIIARDVTIISLNNVSKIRNNAFCNCTKLATLIIENDTVCPLENVNAFDGTYIGNGTGIIYVPKELIEEYKVAANWSRFASQFKSIM